MNSNTRTQDPIKKTTKERFEKNWDTLFKQKKSKPLKPKVIRCNGNCADCDRKSGTCLIIADS